ncbi:cupin domain-containing protein [Phaeodactylibacter luteus]|uniref:Cupin domain-containing protein n=1 Tax=Phaeodactylibacter luteus TaxID=1564516 RepID=A0A5C6RHS6_9BACT|nr:cupin domain-containing protein [Phaeodactylibacter luteus]TXB60594.1 cupin domain-containing protein [Phaeodactylibacter luteus]
MLFKPFSQLPAFTAGDETEIREVLHPHNDGVAFGYSLAHATLEPGQASLPHTLHGRSETYIIQSGAGKAMIAGEEVELGPGDTVYIPAGAEQHIRNVGDGPLTFWCIVCPPWSAETEEVLPKGQ